MLLGALLTVTHHHLDEELREDRWDRTHPQFPDWVIHGSYPDEEVGDILGELLHVWLIAGLPVLIGSGLVGFWLARRSVKPIREINHALDALDPTRTSQGLVLREKDPALAELVKHLNDLLQRVHTATSEIADFSARVAHELRTPLTHLRMKLESSAADWPTDFAEEFSDELAHLSRMVERSLLLAKADSARIQPRLELIPLAELLEDFQETYTSLAAENGQLLAWNAHVPGTWCGDPEWLRQILHNLLGNVIRHGGRPAQFTATWQQGSLLLRVTNELRDGPAPASAGMGLGLRLLQKLTDLMPGARFRLRRSRRAFSARLILPRQNCASPPASQPARSALTGGPAATLCWVKGWAASFPDATPAQ